MTCAAAPFAGAQTYPSQPIKIVVPTAPGGVADIVGRSFAQKLNEAGKTAVVENKTGAGGAIAADFVAKSPPDGYTIYVGFHATNAILPHLQKLNYNPETDLLPVTIAAKTANVLVVNPSVPAKSMKELIAYAKANPGKLTFASQGNGSTGHIVGEQFKSAAGIDINHVPYRGAAPAAQDLIAGHVTMLFDVLTTAVPQIKSDKVRAIAIADAKRAKSLPEVPTVAEAGLPELESGPWFGFFVPAGTPKPVIDWLYAEAKKAFNSPDVQAQFEKQGLTAMLGTPEQTRAFVAGEYKRWGDVIKKANITLN
ncbi:tripartite tricarboxylate transporter substrate binding protein [Pseudorhodoplanes sp.]|uniref:Bug family tripartite tricarboxylate transporter substrate binding protein n=1 Tax=Pseudorhodoplanes sp. TaxID=1934341 RepID=UPI002C774850|nr:tripartite tricarboxylate transporter substrate binding protein [Pseudorhodoplanes sp.]HWV54693.1 tripartite tricarboxylate transporter substrate binding protein [Pseudorhodoplanes sp.]